MTKQSKQLIVCENKPILTILAYLMLNLIFSLFWIDNCYRRTASDARHLRER